jgi:hypothetical protein
MRHPFRNAAASALCLVLLLACLTGCQSASTPMGTLQRFVTAYNRLDMNGLLDCVEPVQAEAARSLLNIVAGISGVGVSGSDLLGVMPLFASLQLPDAQGQSMGSVMPKLSVEAGELSTTGDAAACPVVMTVSIGGQQQSYSGTCTFVRENGRWYIGNLQ